MSGRRFGESWKRLGGLGSVLRGLAGGPKPSQILQNEVPDSCCSDLGAKTSFWKLFGTLLFTTLVFFDLADLVFLFTLLQVFEFLGGTFPHISATASGSEILQKCAEM